MKDEEVGKEGLLVTAAKALGSAAGKIVSGAKRGSSASVTASDSARAEGAEPGRIAKSSKLRLPRKLKKANKKKALRSGL